MKLKPVRGEIRTTNPMPNLGSSLVDAVKANAPQEQRVVNSLINLANKAKDTRDKLETQRIRDKNTVEEEKLKERLLVSEDTINLGNRDGNLLSVEQIEESKKVMYDSVLKDYDPKNINSPYYKDKTAFDSFESGMYNQMNLSRLRVNKKRDDSIKFTANKVYGETKTNSYNELKNLPISNYWISSDTIRDKFLSKVNSRALVDSTVDVTKELFDYDKTSTINYLGKIYTMTDALGREVPDFAAMYIALTNTKEFEKLNLDLPGGKFEQLKNRKYVKNLGKDIPIDLRNAIKEELKDNLTDQVFVEKNQIDKHNAEVEENFANDLIDPEKNISFKDLNKYTDKLIGYEKGSSIDAMTKDLQDKQRGITYEKGEKAESFLILGKALRGEITSYEQKFRLPGESESQSIVDRMMDINLSYLSTNTFRTEFNSAVKTYQTDKAEFYKFIKDSKQIQSLNQSLIDKGKIGSIGEARLEGVIINATKEAKKLKDKALSNGVAWDNNMLLDPKSDYYLFTDGFILNNKFNQDDVLNDFQNQVNTKKDIDNYDTVKLPKLNSNNFRKLKKTGVMSFNSLQIKYLENLGLEPTTQNFIIQIQEDENFSSQFSQSDLYLNWKYSNVNRKIFSMNYIYHRNRNNKKFIEYFESNNIPVN